MPKATLLRTGGCSTWPPARPAGPLTGGDRPRVRPLPIAGGGARMTAALAAPPAPAQALHLQAAEAGAGRHTRRLPVHSQLVLPAGGPRSVPWAPAAAGAPRRRREDGWPGACAAAARRPGRPPTRAFVLRIACRHPRRAAHVPRRARAGGFAGLLAVPASSRPSARPQPMLRWARTATKASLGCLPAQLAAMPHTRFAVCSPTPSAPARRCFTVSPCVLSLPPAVLFGPH